MPEGGEVARRKPRSKSLFKIISKHTKKLSVWSIPCLRYSIVPGMLVFALYYTEPAPTLLELLNPLF